MDENGMTWSLMAGLGLGMLACYLVALLSSVAILLDLQDSRRIRESYLIILSRSTLAAGTSEGTCMLRVMNLRHDSSKTNDCCFHLVRYYYGSKEHKVKA